MKKLIAVFLLCFLFAGCTAAKSSSSASANPAGAAQPQETNFVYDFDDVIIPKEMTLNMKDSYVLDTAKFKSGVQVFEGRVVAADLIEFFMNTMPRDNWQLVTAMKGEKSTLLFDKPGKSCSIQISDGYTVKMVVMCVEDKLEAVQEEDSLPAN